MDLYTSYTDDEYDPSMEGGKYKRKTKTHSRGRKEKATSKIGRYSKLRSKLLREGYDSRDAKDEAYFKVFGHKKSKSKSRRKSKSMSRGRKHRGGAGDDEDKLKKIEKRYLLKMLKDKKEEERLDDKYYRDELRFTEKANKSGLKIYNDYEKEKKLEEDLKKKADFDDIIDFQKRLKNVKIAKIAKELKDRGFGSKYIESYLIKRGLKEEEVPEKKGKGYYHKRAPHRVHHRRVHHRYGGEELAGEELAGILYGGETIPGYEDMDGGEFIPGYEDMDEVGGILYGGAAHRRRRKSKSKSKRKTASRGRKVYRRKSKTMSKGKRLPRRKSVSYY